VRRHVLACVLRILLTEVLQEPRRVALGVLPTTEAAKDGLPSNCTLELGYQCTSKDTRVPEYSGLTGEVGSVKRDNMRIHHSSVTVLSRDGYVMLCGVEEKECTIELLRLELVSPEGL
jgi:hypothetical protein